MKNQAQSRWKPLAFGAAMVAASGLALALRPTPVVPDGSVELERMIPKKFGRWTAVPSGAIQIDLTPRDGETTMDRPYDQTLMRSYVRDDGASVMLALAWGRVQRQEVKIHRPELCYVAQGFTINSRQTANLDLGSGIVVPAYRLGAGSDGRSEPVTYWIRIGEKISSGAWQTRVGILKEGIAGRIPDGILVRVSQALPRGASMQDSYQAQEAFLRDLVSSLDKTTLPLLVGKTKS
jgi:EpsI family protein